MFSALNLADLNSTYTGGVGVGGASASLLLLLSRPSLLVLLWLTCQELRIAQSKGGVAIATASQYDTGLTSMTQGLVL